MIGSRSYKGLLKLALMLVVLPLAVWKFALSDTFAAVKDVARLKRTMTRIEESRQAEGPSVNFTAPETDLITTGLILEKISSRAEDSGASIVEYSPYINEETGGLGMLSAEITLTGNYISILKVLDFLENDLDDCEVRSVSFEKSLATRERRTILKATIVIQQLISL